MTRFRVSFAEPHTVHEYIVEAASRDDAWRLVERQHAELVPCRSFAAGGGVRTASFTPEPEDGE